MNSLPLGVTLLVLFAGLLHATWNALIKSSRSDALLDTALITAGSWLSAAAVIPFLPFPDRAAWPYMATSAAIHFGYYVALAGAYQHGDLGYAYPIMRGTAPLLVTLSGIVFLGELPRNDRGKVDRRQLLADPVVPVVPVGPVERGR